jgi:hypothetical protein
MKDFTSALFVTGALLLLVGAVTYITAWQPAPYLYMIGACMVAVAQINMPAAKKTPTIRRLRMQQIFGALFLVASGVLMFFAHGNEWMVCLAIGAVLQLYSAFRLPYEEGKE